MTNINLKVNTHSDTSSSYNDSCYGSSEMDEHHHHHQHQLGNASTGKILLSSNDKYIILGKDQNNTNHEETNSSSSSSSSSPTTGNNINLITKYQLNKRAETVQLKSSNQNLEFFQNSNEYRKILGATTFNYRNVTPSNEYYL